MLPAPSTLATRARDRWQTLSRLQQVALGVGSVVLIAMIFFFATWSQQTSYGVLFSNLSTQDAAAIVTQLKTSKIPYQLADNGNAILVPTSMVSETRLMLAGAGLPNNGVVGFEIFDKANPLTMTDFTQQLDYLRGLEGELERTIMQIHGVTGAWVNIVLPQSSLYTSSQADPTASLVIGMQPGAQLDPGQVMAIMHLVASSVQGLKPENVTVVDTNGVNLSDQVQQSGAGTALTSATYGTAMDVQQSYQSQLSQEASSMLATVLGPGKAVVRVNATLNWDQLQQDSTTYGQQPNQVSSQSTSSTTSNGPTGPTTSGPPGTGSNLVPTPTVTSGTGSSTYNQTNTNTVYNVSQTVSHLVKAPGTVQRLTVAVFLDGTYPPATIAAIQQAVANAIGLDPTRGDLINVTAIPFNQSNVIAAQQALKTQQQQAQIDLYLRGALIAVVALALLVFAYRATRRPRRALASTTVMLMPDNASGTSIAGAAGPSVALPAPGDGEGGQSEAILLTSGQPGSSLQQARQRQLTEAEIARRNSLREDLISTAKQHPDVLANVILSYIEE